MGKQRPTNGPVLPSWAITGAVPKGQPVINSTMDTANGSDGKNDVGLVPGMDQNEVRASNQTTGEKWKNGLTKMAGTAVTSFAEPFLDMLVGGTEALTNDGSASSRLRAVYDNSATQAMDGFNKYLQEQFPNYASKKEQDLSLLGEMGTANFWADKVGNGVGFMLGAIASGAVTGGLADYAKAGKMAKGLATAAQLADEATQGIKGTAEVLGAVKNAASFTSQHGRDLLVGLAGSMGESGMEGRQIAHDTGVAVRKALVADAGGDPNDYENFPFTNEQKAHIKELEDASGNVGFGINLVLTGVENALLLPKVFRKGYSAEKVAMNAIEGSMEAGYKTADMSLGKKVAKTLQHLAIDNAGEATQEQLQYAVEQGLPDFYRKQRDPAATTDFNDAVNSTISGLGDAYGTKAGWENALLGGVIGIFGGAFKLGEVGAQQRTTQAAVQTLNDAIAAKPQQAMMRSMIAQNAFGKEKQAAEVDGDERKARDADFGAFSAMVRGFSQAGKIEDVVEDIEKAGTLSPEEFKTRMGLDADAKLPELPAKMAAKQVEKVRQLHELSEQIEAAYPGDNNGGLRDAFFGIAAKSKDNEGREAKLAAEVYKTTGIPINTLMRNGNSEESLNSFLDKISDWAAAPERLGYERDAVVQKAQDLLALSNERIQLASAYRKMEDPKHREAMSIAEGKLKDIADAKAAADKEAQEAAKAQPQNAPAGAAATAAGDEEYAAFDEGDDLVDDAGAPGKSKAEQPKADTVALSGNRTPDVDMGNSSKAYAILNEDGTVASYNQKRMNLSDNEHLPGSTAYKFSEKHPPMQAAVAAQYAAMKAEAAAKATAAAKASGSSGMSAEVFNSYFDPSLENASDSAETQEARKKYLALNKEINELPDHKQFPDGSQEKADAITAVDALLPSLTFLNNQVLTARLAALKQTQLFKDSAAAQKTASALLQEAFLRAVKSGAKNISGDSWVPSMGISENEYKKLVSDRAQLFQLNTGTPLALAVVEKAIADINAYAAKEAESSPMVLTEKQKTVIAAIEELKAGSPALKSDGSVYAIPESGQELDESSDTYNRATSLKKQLVDPRRNALLTKEDEEKSAAWLKENPQYAERGNIADLVIREFFIKGSPLTLAEAKAVIDDYAQQSKASGKDIFNRLQVEDSYYEDVIRAAATLKAETDKLGWHIISDVATLHGLVGDAKFAGTTDLVAVDKDGNLHILDLKTNEGSRVADYKKSDIGQGKILKAGSDGNYMADESKYREGDLIQQAIYQSLLEQRLPGVKVVSRHIFSLKTTDTNNAKDTGLGIYKNANLEVQIGKSGLDSIAINLNSQTSVGQAKSVPLGTYTIDQLREHYATVPGQAAAHSQAGVSFFASNTENGELKEGTNMTTIAVGHMPLAVSVNGDTATVSINATMDVKQLLKAKLSTLEEFFEPAPGILNKEVKSVTAVQPAMMEKTDGVWKVKKDGKGTLLITYADGTTSADKAPSSQDPAPATKKELAAAKGALRTAAKAFGNNAENTSQIDAELKGHMKAMLATAFTAAQQKAALKFVEDMKSVTLADFHNALMALSGFLSMLPPIKMEEKDLSAPVEKSMAPIGPSFYSRMQGFSPKDWAPAEQETQLAIAAEWTRNMAANTGQRQEPVHVKVEGYQLNVYTNLNGKEVKIGYIGSVTKTALATDTDAIKQAYQDLVALREQIKAYAQANPGQNIPLVLNTRSRIDSAAEVQTDKSLAELDQRFMVSDGLGGLHYEIVEQSGLYREDGMQVYTNSLNDNFIRNLSPEMAGSTLTNRYLMRVQRPDGNHVMIGVNAAPLTNAETFSQIQEVLAADIPEAEKAKALNELVFLSHKGPFGDGKARLGIAFIGDKKAVTAQVYSTEGVDEAGNPNDTPLGYLRFTAKSEQNTADGLLATMTYFPIVDGKVSKEGLPATEVVGMVRSVINKNDSPEERLAKLMPSTSAELWKDVMPHPMAIDAPGELASVVAEKEEIKADVIAAPAAASMDLGGEKSAKKLSRKESIAKDLADKLAADKAATARKVMPRTAEVLESENFKEIESYVADKLPAGPEGFSVRQMMEQVSENGITVGYFLDMGINLAQSAPKGTGYHEAFHAVFRVLLNGEQRNKYYALAKRSTDLSAKAKDAFRQLHPQYAAMSEARLEAEMLEERMADLFSDYVKGKAVPMPSLFQKIVNFIKWLFTGGERPVHGQLRELFAQIDNGGFKNSTVRDVNSLNGMAAKKTLAFMNTFDSERTVRLLTGDFLKVFGESDKSMETEDMLNQVLETRKQELSKPADYFKGTAAQQEAQMKQQNYYQADEEELEPGEEAGRYYPTSFYYEEDRQALKQQVLKESKNWYRVETLDENQDEEVETVAGSDPDTTSERMYDQGNLSVQNKPGKEVVAFIKSTTYINPATGIREVVDYQPTVELLSRILDNKRTFAAMQSTIVKLVAGGNQPQMAAVLNNITSKLATSDGPFFQRQFVKAFYTLYANPMVTLLNKETGETVRFSANRSTTELNLVNRWRESIEGKRRNPAILKEATKSFNKVRMVINSQGDTLKQRHEDENALISSLGAMGIDISPTFLRNVLDGNEEQYTWGKDATNKRSLNEDLIQIALQLSNNQNPFMRKVEDREGEANKSTYVQSNVGSGAISRGVALATADANYRQDIVDSSAQGADGKPIFSRAQPSFIGERGADLTNGDYTLTGKPWLKHSLVVRYQSDGSNIIKNVRLRAETGIREEKTEDGLTPKDKDPKSYLLQEMANFRSKKGENVERDITFAQIEAKSSGMTITIPVYAAGKYFKDGKVTKKGAEDLYFMGYQDFKNGEEAIVDLYPTLEYSATYGPTAPPIEGVHFLKRALVVDGKEVLPGGYDKDGNPRLVDLATVREFQNSGKREMLPRIFQIVSLPSLNALTNEQLQSQEAVSKFLAGDKEEGRESFEQQALNDMKKSLAEAGLDVNNPNDVKLMMGDKSGYKNIDEFLGDLLMTNLLWSDAYFRMTMGSQAWFAGDVDTTKRMAMMIAAGPSMGEGNHRFAALETHDSYLNAKTLLPITKAQYEAGVKADKASGQTSVRKADATDAQVYWTADMAKKFYMGIGKLTAATSAIWDKVIAGEKLTTQEQHLMLDEGVSLISAKGVYASQLADGSMVYLKFSAHVLSPEITSFQDGKGNWHAKPDMEAAHQLHQWMLSNRIDASGHDTAVKVGLRNKNFRDSKGMYSGDAKYMELPNNGLREQMQNPSGKQKIIYPTQVLQLLDEGMQDYDKVELNGVEMSIKDVRDSYQQLFADVRKSLMEDAQIATQAIVSGNRLLVGQILSTLEASGASPTELSYFQHSESSPDFLHSTDLPSVNKRFQKLFLSVYNKQVLALKAPGSKYTLVTSANTKVVVGPDGQLAHDWSKDYKDQDYLDKNFKLKEGYTTRELQMHGPNQTLEGAKVIFGHPTIGKTFLKESAEHKNSFISLDDDYAQHIKDFIAANKKPGEDKYQYQERKPQEFIDFTLSLFNTAKAKAEKEGKMLFTSNNIVLDKMPDAFDKVINLSNKEFTRRIGERNTTYDIAAWKNQINGLISKVDPSKVINTDGYLADLLPKNGKAPIRLAEVYLSEELLLNTGMTLKELYALDEATRNQIISQLGVRIPFQSHHSAMPFKVVGWVPAHYGSVVIAPAGITTLSGADYDIDSLYVLRKEFWQGKDKSWHVYGAGAQESVIRQQFIAKLEANMAESLGKKTLSDKDREKYADLYAEHEQGYAKFKKAYKRSHAFEEYTHAQGANKTLSAAKLAIRESAPWKEAAKRIEELGELLGDRKKKSKGSIAETREAVDPILQAIRSNLWLTTEETPAQFASFQKSTDQLLALAVAKTMLGDQLKKEMAKLDELRHQAHKDVRVAYTQQEYEALPKDKQGSTYATYGAIMDHNMAIIRNPANAESLTTPSETKPLQDIATRLSAFMAKDTQQQMPYHLISTRAAHQFNNMVGGANIGPTALANTVSALLTKHRYEFARAFYFMGERMTGYANNLENDITISPDGKVNVVMNSARKANSLSTLVSAMADNAKERIAAALNLTRDNLMPLANLVAMGYGLQRTMLFAGQPAMRMLSQRYRATMSVVDINANQTKVSENLIFEIETRMRTGKPQTGRGLDAAKERTKQTVVSDVAMTMKELRRELAKAIHPDMADNEDEAQVAQFTDLAQRANAAYDDKDLGTLLGVYMEASQVEGVKLAPLSVEQQGLADEAHAKGITKEEIGNAMEDQLKDLSFDLDAVLKSTEELTQDQYDALDRQIEILMEYGSLIQQTKYFKAVSTILSGNKGVGADFTGIQKIDDAREKTTMPIKKRKPAPVPGGIYLADILRAEHGLRQNLDNIDELKATLPKFFLARTDTAQAILASVKELMPGAKDEELLAAELDLTTFLAINAFQEMGNTTKNEFRLATMEGLFKSEEDNLGRKLEDLRKLAEDNPEEYGWLKNNAFLRSVSIRKPAPGTKETLYGISFNTRQKVSPEFAASLEDGFRELMGPASAEANAFAVDAFRYLAAKDNFQYKNGTFVSQVPELKFRDLSNSLKQIHQQLMARQPEIGKLTGYNTDGVEHQFLTTWFTNKTYRDHVLGLGGTPGDNRYGNLSEYFSPVGDGLYVFAKSAVRGDAALTALDSVMSFPMVVARSTRKDSKQVLIREATPKGVVSRLDVAYYRVVPELKSAERAYYHLNAEELAAEDRDQNKVKEKVLVPTTPVVLSAKSLEQIKAGTRTMHISAQDMTAGLNGASTRLETMADGTVLRFSNYGTRNLQEMTREKLENLAKGLGYDNVAQFKTAAQAVPFAAAFFDKGELYVSKVEVVKEDEPAPQAETKQQAPASKATATSPTPATNQQTKSAIAAAVATVNLDDIRKLLANKELGMGEGGTEANYRNWLYKYALDTVLHGDTEMVNNLAHALSLEGRADNLAVTTANYEGDKEKAAFEDTLLLNVIGSAYSSLQATPTADQASAEAAAETPMTASVTDSAEEEADLADDGDDDGESLTGKGQGLFGQRLSAVKAAEQSVPMTPYVKELLANWKDVMKPEYQRLSDAARLQMAKDLESGKLTTTCTR